MTSAATDSSHPETSPEGEAPSPGGVRGENTIVSDYSLVTVAGLISALVSFVSAMLTTRLLAPQAFGALSMVLVTSLILQTATSSWTALAVARFGRELIELTGRMTSVTWARLALVTPWFAAATALILLMKLGSLLPAELTWPLVAAAVLHGGVAIGYEHCTNLLRSWGRQRLSAVTVLTQQLALLVVVAGLMATGLRVQALQIALLYVAGSAGLLLLYTPLLWNIGLRPVKRDRKLERRIRHFSVPLIAFTVSSYVIASVDLWILGIYAAPSAVGSYAAVYRAYTTLMTVAAAATPVLTTLFVSLRLAGRAEAIGSFMERGVPTVVVACGCVGAPLIAPAASLVPIAFGRAFASAELPFAILLVSVIAYLHCCLVGTVLTAYDRTADTARAIAIAAVLNVLGDWVAIGLFGAGIWAPAVATAAASFLMAIAYVRAGARCSRTRSQFSLWGYAAPLFAVVVLAVAPAHLRVVASVAAGVIVGALSLLLSARHGEFDARLLAESVPLRLRRLAISSARN